MDDQFGIYMIPGRRGLGPCTIWLNAAASGVLVFEVFLLLYGSTDFLSLNFSLSIFQCCEVAAETSALIQGYCLHKLN